MIHGVHLLVLKLDLFAYMYFAESLTVKSGTHCIDANQWARYENQWAHIMPAYTGPFMTLSFVCQMGPASGLNV